LSFPLGNNTAASLPIKLDVPSEVDLHQREAVFVFRKQAEKITACHQLAVGKEDDTEAEVFWVTLNLNAVKVERRTGFAIHELVYGAVKSFS
jgi:hypothetical protein